MHGILSLVEEMFDDPTLQGAHHEMVTTIKESSATLLTIISDLLDYSKSQAGHLRLHPFVFDLHEMLQSTVTLFSWKATHLSVSMKLLLEPPQHPTPLAKLCRSPAVSPSSTQSPECRGYPPREWHSPFSVRGSHCCRFFLVPL